MYLIYSNWLNSYVMHVCKNNLFLAYIDVFKYDLGQLWCHLLFICLVALRPKSTAMVMAGRSVHLTTLFPGQAWTSS